MVLIIKLWVFIINSFIYCLGLQISMVSHYNSGYYILKKLYK